MVIESLPGARLWNGFQAVSLVAPRVAHPVALPAVAQVQIRGPAHPAPLWVVQEALPAALPGVFPDFRNRLIEKKTGVSSSRTAYEHSPSWDDFNRV